MANFYSNALSFGGSSTVLPASNPNRNSAGDAAFHAAPPGLLGAPLKVRSGVIDFTAAGAGDYADADVLAMIPVSSSDRLWGLWVGTDGAFNAATTLTIDVGLYGTGDDGRSVGTVIDDDVFESALSIDAALDTRTDVFEGTATLEGDDRGSYLWEIAAAGAGSYTEDPREDWIITVTLNVAGAVSAGGVLVCEAHITDA